MSIPLLPVLKSSLIGGSLPTELASFVLLTTPLHGPGTKHRFQKYLYSNMHIHFRGKVFTEPLPRNASGILYYIAVVAL
jgi:hypothetical protein